MTPLGTFKQAREKVKSDIATLLAAVQSISSRPATTVEAGVALLNQLRREVYEDLNQIQHEQMILCAAEWLIEHRECSPQTVWSWNPRQTGDHTQPDLQGMGDAGEVLVSAEITTSMTAVGTIDGRMRDTLLKMMAMPGKKFYFVRTDVMKRRADSKVRNLALAGVTVVRLPDSCFGDEVPAASGDAGGPHPAASFATS